MTADATRLTIHSLGAPHCQNIKSDRKCFILLDYTGTSSSRNGPFRGRAWVNTLPHGREGSSASKQTKELRKCWPRGVIKLNYKHESFEYIVNSHMQWRKNREKVDVGSIAVRSSPRIYCRSASDQRLRPPWYGRMPGAGSLSVKAPPLAYLYCTPLLSVQYARGSRGGLSPRY